MKIRGYSFHCERPLFVYLRKHACPACKGRLLRQRVSEIIHSDSEEAKNYNFELADIRVKGNVKFSHIAFYCPECQKNYTVQEIHGLEKYPPKKIAALWILCAAVVICIFLLGWKVLPPVLTFTLDHFPIVTVDPRYDAVFEGTYLFHTHAYLPGRTMQFARREDNGAIHCLDCGYQGDIVCKWIETVYIPIGKYTDDQKEQLEQTFRKRYATEEALPFCSVQYQMGVDYFIITCTVSDLDQKENCTALYEANLISKDTRISMSSTRNKLVRQGFIKK